MKLKASIFCDFSALLNVAAQAVPLKKGDKKCYVELGAFLLTTVSPDVAESAKNQMLACWR